MQIEELYRRPAFNVVPVASVRLRDTAAGVNAFIESQDSKCSPDLQAFAFYYLDHCVALIRGKYPSRIPEDLEQIVELYHGMTTRFGTSMFAYLLVICNREFRYCKSADPSYIELTGATPAAKFGIDLQGVSSTTAFSMMKDAPESLTLGAWSEYMTKGYYKLSWGSMYGGKKWGDITKVLENYVLGKIPLVTLLDQSFSLQHNTSAIFNKGTIYNKESQEMELLLDVQHAGQVVSLAHDLFFGVFDPLKLRNKSGNKMEQSILGTLKEVHVRMAMDFKEDFSQHVDWLAVANSNPKTSKNKIEAVMKNAYSTFGIYDSKPVSAVKAPYAEVQEVYVISPTEAYPKVTRTKK